MYEIICLLGIASSLFFIFLLNLNINDYLQCGFKNHVIETLGSVAASVCLVWLIHVLLNMLGWG